MTTLPATSSFTGSSVTEAGFKAALTDLRAYLAESFGATGEPLAVLAALGALASSHTTRDSTWTLPVDQRGRVIDMTETWTLTLPAAATATAGWLCLLRNVGSGVITVERSGSDLIDGATSRNLGAGAVGVLMCDGAGWKVVTIPAVTTSSSDTTAGRLLKVGDFGWGAVGVNLDNTGDLNAIPNMGFGNNSQTSVPANDPLGSGNRRMAGVQFGTVNATAQIVLDTSATDRQRMFCRVKSIGTWGGWFEPMVATSVPPAPPNGDFNDANLFGPTQTFSAATNKPAGNGHAVLTLPRSATNFAQLSMRTDTTLRYDTLLQGRQMSSAGGAGAWVNFFHTHNIVGTVSATDGIPTGAVFEGNAADASPTGGYVERIADGFQTAHHSLTSSDSADTTWTYNTAFLTATTPVLSIQPVGDADYTVRLVSRSNTACVFSIRDSGGGRVAIAVDLIARGRWGAL